MKKKALILMLSGVLLLSACSDKSESSEIIKFPIVEANSGYTEYTVKTEDFAVYKEFSAKIAFPYAQEVRYGKEGKITSILAKEGMTVKKDEVLATIDDTEIQKQISLKYDELNKAANNDDKKIINAEIDILKSQAEDCKIKSPIDGVIVGVTLNSVGSTISKSDYIFKVDSYDTAFVSISFTDAEYMKFGKQAVVLSDEEEISSAYYVETKSGKDIFRLDKNDIMQAKLEELKQEKFTVNIEEEYVKDAITIPNEALMKYSGNYYAYIMMNDKKIEMPVNVGVSNGEKTQITGGLNPGDTVLIFN